MLAQDFIRNLEYSSGQRLTGLRRVYNNIRGGLQPENVEKPLNETLIDISMGKLQDSLRDFINEHEGKEDFDINYKTEEPRKGEHKGEQEREMTALMYAAKKGLNEHLKILLENGARIYDSDSLGRTALMHAVRGGDHVEVVKTLLEAMKSEKGEKEAWKLCQQPIRIRGRREEKPLCEPRTVRKYLFWTSQKYWNIIPEVDDFRSPGINQRDTSGETALMHAARMGHLNVVEALLKHGADKTLKQEDGEAAYELCKKGSTKIRRKLWFRKK